MAEYMLYFLCKCLWVMEAQVDSPKRIILYTGLRLGLIFISAYSMLSSLSFVGQTPGRWILQSHAVRRLRGKAIQDARDIRTRLLSYAEPEEAEGILESLEQFSPDSENAQTKVKELISALER